MSRAFKAPLLPVAIALAIALLAAGTLIFGSAHISREQVGYTGPRAANCLPSELDRSAVIAGSGVSVSPLPDSYDASPKTQISFLGAPARKLHGITVSGSQSGEHQGRLEPYSQGDGASFVPESPFQPGETVTVSGEVERASGEKSLSYRFTVAHPDPIPIPEAGPQEKAPPGSIQRFRSAPGLKPPSVDIGKDLGGSAPGDIFMAPYSGPGGKGPTILAPDGQLVWMDSLPGALKATNFQVERYEGKPVLTWWQGYIPPQGFGLGEEIVADTSYRQILHIKPGNGEPADLHDFHLEGDHTAVLTVFDTIDCDLSSAGGPGNAAVTDGLFQELDVRTGLVRREWTSVDHVALSESYSKVMEASAENPFDFFHINAVDPRPDGRTLLSSRNTSALWLIDDKTGQVVAKVGGKHSTIEMGPGTRTAYQHDSMTLPDGDISIFDNGGSPFEKPWSETHSRPIVTHLDLADHTDTLVLKLHHDPPIPAASQGNVQLLPDGNWFVGWGQEPYFTEYDHSGKLIYEGRMWAEKGVRELETESYRTYRFPWHATPYWPPAIAAASRAGGDTIYASWNGATGVSGWRVLGGPSRRDLQPLATAAKQGFETAIEVAPERYVAVEALERSGAVIGRSATVKG